MINHWQWFLKHLFKHIWFKVTLFSLLGILTAFLAFFLKPYIPDSLAGTIGTDAVDKILTIIGSSMLAVTTFSLSIMVNAYGSATNTVTPRATTLLIEDSVTQNVLGTFIGSFLFSVVGIIALSNEIYGDRGRVVLFVVTLLVVILVVYALLRWISCLTELGRVGETSDRVEEAATCALKERIQYPYLGGRRLPEKNRIPANLHEIAANEVGYVQIIDMKALGRISERYDCDIYVFVLPGSFVSPSEPMVGVTVEDDTLRQKIQKAITLGTKRLFDQDPRFGLAVLCEIGSRALSPATNDCGTAIDIIGRGVRLLSLWAKDQDDIDGDASRSYSRVFVPGLSLDDMFDDFFRPLARDGASELEIGVRLLKALASLARLNSDFWTVSRRYATLSLKYAEAALVLEEDKQILRDLSEKVGREADRSSVGFKSSS